MSSSSIPSTGADSSPDDEACVQLLQLFESVPRIRTLLGVAEHSTSLDLSARHGTLGPAGVRLLAAELGARRAVSGLPCNIRREGG